MLKTRIITIFLGLLIIAGCTEAKDLSQKEYLVKQIIDGDTIELTDGIKVRYIGIDTPEVLRKKYGTKVFDPEEYALAAKKLNERLLSGKKVKLEFDKVKRDKYGRVLAYVYNEDGQMINEELVRSGYATVYTIPPNMKYLDLLLKVQQQARDKKKGIWSSLKTIDIKDAENNIDNIVRIKGKVEDVFISANKLVLVLIDDNEKWISGLIYMNNLSLFSDKGIDSSVYFLGKDVEIIGKVRKRKDGLYIVVDNPSCIEVKK